MGLIKASSGSFVDIDWLLVSHQFSRQFETFVQPAGDAADHQLDWPPELRETDGAARCAVAMRPGAIRNE